MAQSTINSDLFVNGALTSKTFTASAGSITDTAIQANAGIQASKLVHQFPIMVRGVGTVATGTTIVHQHYAAATVQAVQVIAGTVSTGGDSVVVDVQRAPSGSTTFTTILSATLTINSGSTALTPVTGTITSPTSAAGDVLRVVQTVTGTSTQNSLVTIWLRENPQ